MKLTKNLNKPKRGGKMKKVMLIVGVVMALVLGMNSLYAEEVLERPVPPSISKVRESAKGENVGTGIVKTPIRNECTDEVRDYINEDIELDEMSCKCISYLYSYCRNTGDEACPTFHEMWAQDSICTLEALSEATKKALDANGRIIRNISQ